MNKECTIFTEGQAKCSEDVCFLWSTSFLTRSIHASEIRCASSNHIYLPMNNLETNLLNAIVNLNNRFNSRSEEMFPQVMKDLCMHLVFSMLFENSSLYIFTDPKNFQSWKYKQSSLSLSRLYCWANRSFSSSLSGFLYSKRTKYRQQNFISNTLFAHYTNHIVSHYMFDHCLHRLIQVYHSEALPSILYR